MPSIKDKLEAEERNERTIRLWPEGNSYKAYERSAYLFVKRVRAYEPRRCYVQAVGQDVVSIEFPQSALGSLRIDNAPATDGAEIIQLPATLDERQYMLWREGKTEAINLQVIKRLHEFNLATATPIDCMLLVSQFMIHTDNIVVTAKLVYVGL